MMNQLICGPEQDDTLTDAGVARKNLDGIESAYCGCVLVPRAATDSSNSETRQSKRFYENNVAIRHCSY